MEREKLIFIYLSSFNHITSGDILAYLNGDTSSARFRSGAEQVSRIACRREFPDAAKKIIEYCAEKEIRVVTYPDPSYPEKLKKIGDAPPALYVLGDSSILEGFAGAVVGSRRPTLSGIRFCEELVREIALRSIPVISGFARGIDSCAHRVVLERSGKTAAVLGSGADVVYPGENEKLYHEIIQSGCVLSRFPPGTPPLGRNFPIRNSIIAALSDFICVIEATRKSGSLITARYGVEYGKEILSVPGNPLYPQSEGTNILIKNGAHPLTGISDILNAFGFTHIDPRKKRRRNDHDLSNVERRLLDILNDAMSLEEISSIMQEDTKDVSATVVLLEMKNLVGRGADGYYYRLG